MTFRSAIALVAVAACCIAATASAQTEAYPGRAVRIVPFGTAGGPIDTIARLYGEKLRERWKQPIVVEAKPGASGTIAADFVAKAPADGYTILLTLSLTHINNVVLQKNIPYDPFKSFAPVTQIATGGPALVAPASVPFNDLKGLVAFAKEKSAGTTYGTWGTGSSAHLFGELLARQTGVKLVHVPYKGVGGAMPDLLAGRVQVMSMAIGSARPYLKTGQLRPLAAGAKHRLANLPDVPTAAEAGVAGWEMSAWFGIFAPRGVAPELVRALNQKLQRVIEDPAVRQRFLDAGAEPVGGSAESFAERYRADHRTWGQFIRETGIRTE